MTNENLCCRIEAVLFVAGEAVRIHDLAVALSVNDKEIEEAVTRLKDEYDFNQRGFIIKCFSDRIQLATRSLYSEDIVRLLQPVQQQSLTQTAMETLAVIAYRQPVTRAEIEQIRGVKCDYSIQSLLLKGLIKEIGRKDTVGRPILFGTTEQFLSHFGLKDLNELPPFPNSSKPDDETGINIIP